MTFENLWIDLQGKVQRNITVVVQYVSGSMLKPVLVKSTEPLIMITMSVFEMALSNLPGAGTIRAVHQSQAPSARLWASHWLSSWLDLAENKIRLPIKSILAGGEEQRLQYLRENHGCAMELWQEQSLKGIPCQNQSPWKGAVTSILVRGQNECLSSAWWPSRAVTFK